jgi:signal transduction histidine kinase
LKIGAAQKLATQGKNKELLKELRDVSDQLRRDARDVRRIIYALRPLDIETLGFLPALKQFTRDFGQANEIELNLSVTGEALHLSPKLDTALFRLTQETLNNIRKHAQAKHVWVELDLTNARHAILQVRDDGTGFDLEQSLQAARARGSVGLVQMRERAERAGGTFNIETATGKGTIIRIQMPIRDA